jgi:hypothetical protein
MAEQWWTAREAVQVFPDDTANPTISGVAASVFAGRKRLLDSLLAATYYQAGIRSLLTTNPTDFGVFGVLACITPAAPT